ncbi:MAG: ABC transporter substrate-binding protein, partial [Pseudomonadota bacterium]|nr:ABC transporter substrate-binding protein [Pseudomonadota bacterium]
MPIPSFVTRSGRGLRCVVRRGTGSLLTSLVVFTAVLAAALTAAPAVAQNLRIATAFDPQTMDPQALALLYHSRVVHQIYESLVSRDAKFATEPALASSWQMTSPTTWRFKLRSGVVFHDGSAFTADDAVFSLQRAMGSTSQRAFQLKGVSAVRAVDPLTLEVVMEAPDAVLPEKLQFVAMMSRAWCEAHGVDQAQNFNAKQETYGVRHANGTGPFKLDKYEPDVRTVLKRFDRWWGWADKRSGNLKQVDWITIKSDATRLAALASGEVDLVMDPPYQDIARLKSDPRLTMLQTADIGQQYLSFDQARPELADSDVKG